MTMSGPKRGRRGGSLLPSCSRGSGNSIAARWERTGCSMAYGVISFGLGLSSGLSVHHRFGSPWMYDSVIKVLLLRYT